MIGVNRPGHFLYYPGTTDEQIDRYAALCVKDDSCRARTDDLSASLRQANAEIPDRWFVLPQVTMKELLPYLPNVQEDLPGLGAPGVAEPEEGPRARGRSR